MDNEMTDDAALQWNDITATRNLILTQSDWTQLPDSELSRSCVLAWRNWRKEVRKVSRQLFSSRLSAVRKLNELKENKPKLEYAGDELYSKEEKFDHPESLDSPEESRTQVATVLYTDIKRIINEVLSKENQSDTLQEPVEPSVADHWDSIDDIKAGRKHAQNEAETAYKMKIKAKSPAIELNALYAERLSEAIDLLSGTGSNFPLLGLLADSLGKNMDNVATSILKTHSNTITNFVAIERGYIEVLKRIKEAGTIAKLKKIIEEYNGH